MKEISDRELSPFTDKLLKKRVSDLALQVMADFVEADIYCFFLYDSDVDSYYIPASSFFPNREPSENKYNFLMDYPESLREDGVPFLSYHQYFKKPVHNYSPELRKNWLVNPATGLFIKSGLRYVMAAPLLEHQHLIGSINSARNIRPFNDSDLSKCSDLANLITLLLFKAPKPEAENGQFPMGAKDLYTSKTVDYKLYKQMETLTMREHEVLDLLLKGLTYSQIAEQIFVSNNTVKQHLKKIYRKLNVNSRARLLVRMYGGA